MTLRRDALKLALAGAAVTTAGAAGRAPILGLLMPVDPIVPPEAAAMYPTGVRFRGGQRRAEEDDAAGLRCGT